MSSSAISDYFFRFSLHFHNLVYFLLNQISRLFNIQESKLPISQQFHPLSHSHIPILPRIRIILHFFFIPSCHIPSSIIHISFSLFAPPFEIFPQWLSSISVFSLRHIVILISHRSPPRARLRARFIFLGWNATDEFIRLFNSR